MGFDVSLAIDRMADYADTLDARVKAIDPQAFTIVMGHVGDGNLHPSVYHEHTPDKHDKF
jgi:FAD/FMN-containing dehydrogenase